MPTVPSTPRFEDFSFELVNLSDGTFHVLTEQDILSADITWVPAPTVQKIESGYVEAPAGTEDNPSILADAMDWDGWQAIRVVPYGDTGYEGWGLLVNYRMAYSGRPVRDTFKISIVPIEFLMHSRVIYDAAGTGFDGGNKPADDLAKYLVKESALAGTVGTDPDGNSRNWNWGTLAVQADASACAAVTADYEIFEDYLDEIIHALSLEYGFVYELKPSVAAGALTFTFNTELTGGVDRTAGANRWVINDFAGRQPAGERTIDRSQLINAMHSRGITEVEIDAASIATYGRWEGIGDGEDDQGLAINLEFSQLREGSNFVYANAWEWMQNWDVGDTVIRSNNRTGLAASNEVIGAVRTTWPERILSIEIRWGLEKGTYTQKNKKAAGRQGGGGGGRSTPGWAQDTEPVADTMALGTSRLLPRADHQHDLLVTADDLNTATIAAGAVTIEGGTYITTSIAAGDLRITHDNSGVGAGGTYGDATHVARTTVDPQGHITAISEVVIAGVAPAAHGITSAYHTVVGNQYDVVAVNPANTLALLASADTPGANVRILRSSATGYLTCVRYQVAAANVYLDGTGSWAILSGDSGVALQDSGVSIVGVTAASGIYPGGAYGCGTAANRWDPGVYSKAGNFTGDITIGTGVGIIHADGVAAGKVLRANGTRYVPATLAVTDCSGYAAHTHSLTFNNIASGNTQPTLSGVTDNWSVYGAISYTAPVTNNAGSALYYDATGHVNTAAGTPLIVPTRPHTHALTGGVATAAVQNHSHTYDKTATPTGVPV